MLVASVTPLDVALVSSVAALAGAVIAPAVTWIATSMRNRHERWVRLYEDRRDAYLTVLRVGYRTADVVAEYIRVLEENSPDTLGLPPPEPESQQEVHARIALYAHEEVARSLGLYEQTRRQAHEAVLLADLTDSDGREAALARLRPLHYALEQSMERLRRVLRDELAET